MPQHRSIYEIELYVVASGLPGLNAGVYHFNPADVSLRASKKEATFAGTWQKLQPWNPWWPMRP